MFKVFVRYNTKDYPEFTLATGATAEEAKANFYNKLGCMGSFRKCSVILYDEKNLYETVLMNYWNY